MTIEVIHLKEPVRVNGADAIAREAARVVEETRKKDRQQLAQNTREYPAHDLYETGKYPDGSTVKSTHKVVVNPTGRGTYFRYQLPDLDKPRSEQVLTASRMVEIGEEMPLYPITTRVKDTDEYKIRSVLMYTHSSEKSPKSTKKRK
jgi:hypothetical protein